MVKDDLDSLPPSLREVLSGSIRDMYADDSPDNWKPFGGDAPVCDLIEGVGKRMGIVFDSQSRHLTTDSPSSEALFRVFVMTNVYIVDCLSLEIRRIAARARDVALAAHRTAAFFVPFDFSDNLRPSMHTTWTEELSLLEFARHPCQDLYLWRNRYIYHEVSSRDSLEMYLENVLYEFERERTGAGPGAGQPTPSAHHRMDRRLAQRGIPQGPSRVPRL